MKKHIEIIAQGVRIGGPWFITNENGALYFIKKDLCQYTGRCTERKYEISQSKSELIIGMFNTGNGEMLSHPVLYLSETGEEFCPLT
jgi:hypothetical protein